ncbi:MAG: glycosyltransferase family 39 protein [Betaproteobacteria bacterium]|nr:glycosyltransferase family 39 protein [Betaproteobacteria bacterium]
MIICAAWIVPGLIGHDPWKPDEAMVFGVIHSILRNGTWLIPTIAGAPAHDYPPFYHWVAAASAKLLSPLLSVHDASRLASGLFMAITLVFTHRTAKRLFDERAGRVAVLLLIGCLGLLVRGHEMNPELAGLAGLSVALYGMTRIRSEPTKGGVTTGLGAGVIAMSIGIVPALLPPLAAILMMAILKDWGNRAFSRGIAIATLVSIPFMLIFPLLLMLAGQASLSPWLGAIFGIPLIDGDGRRGIELTYFIGLLPWYGLPALPFAIWLWWKDRAKLRERVELALPLAAFLATLLLLSFTRRASDAVAVALLVPLALAAANTLDRLPRGLASFLDWFGLVFFGLAAIAAWLYWTAAMTGFPAGAARAVARQAPGFTFSFQLIPFLIALILTLIWAYAVVRAHRNNRRAIVNWAAGITMIWVLPNLLALPAFDHVRSYRGVSAQLASQIPAQRNCVASIGLGDAQRALLDYFAGLRFIPAGTTGSHCEWLLTQGTRDRVPYVPEVNETWAKVWEGARPGDNSERLRLYKRQPLEVSQAHPPSLASSL